MANSFTGNVQFVDTSATFSHIKQICGLKYMVGSATSSAVTIYGEAATATAVWAEDSTASNSFEEVKIRDNKGLTVIPAGGASVYIYLRV